MPFLRLYIHLQDTIIQFYKRTKLSQSLCPIICYEQTLDPTRKTFLRPYEKNLIGVFKNFAKFTEKHPGESIFFIQKETRTQGYRCFPMNFAKFLRTLFLQNTSKRLVTKWLSKWLAISSCSERHIEYLYKDTLKKNFENLVHPAIFELGKQPRDYYFSFKKKKCCFFLVTCQP